MSRIQLALNVDDIEEATAFYTKLFGAEPAKIRPGYANFAIADPPLKLILFQAPGKGGTINHLGVEVGSPEEVAAVGVRLAESGLGTRPEDNVSCCYATQDKVWASAPDGLEWEYYTVLADSEQFSPEEGASDAACCAPATDDVSSAAACC
jgi:catechol 2,3-dioxygenase-like lactoylglutathione lyase family enzyme